MTDEIAAITWLLERGATSSNPWLRGVYEQCRQWAIAQDEAPTQHLDPLSPKQIAELIKQHKNWVARRQIRENVRSAFRGS